MAKLWHEMVPEGAAGPDAASFREWQSAKGGRIEVARGDKGELIRLKFDDHSRVIERRVERKGFREQVWRYGWDGEDRLIECFTPSGARYTYTYDPFGRRVAKQGWVRAANRASASDSNWEASEKTLYLWDGDVLARESLVDAKDETLRETRWHFEPESFVPLAKEEGERLWYVVTDHLGTPRELLSEDGALVWAAEYGTWGGVRRLWQADNDNEDLSRGDLQGYDLDGNPVYATRFQTSGNLALKPLENPDPLFCPIRFQGQWADEESGLYYNRFRYYDPLTAQYLSPDPIGINGGMRSLGYVNNPNGYIDPFGLNPSCSDRVSQMRKLMSDFKKELRDYIPESDALGGHPHRYGVTVPGGHYKEMRQLQRGLKNELKAYNLAKCYKCASASDKITTKAAQAVINQPVDVPPGMSFIPL